MGMNMEMMDRMLNSLVHNRTESEMKSYLVGLERGRIWASGTSDYFEMREWSEMKPEEYVENFLPKKEEMHFRILQAETPLEWESYVKGWVAGVKEIASEY